MMPVSVEQMLDTLRDEGFAVAVVYPEYLRGADPERVEEAMYRAGYKAVYQAIEPHTNWRPLEENE